MGNHVDFALTNAGPALGKVCEAEKETPPAVSLHTHFVT
jgi:hypothetical protein